MNYKEEKINHKDNIDGIIIRNSISITGKVNGKYFHEIEFDSLSEGLNTYFSQTIDELEAKHKEEIEGLKERIQKSMDVLNDNPGVSNNEQSIGYRQAILEVSEKINEL